MKFTNAANWREDLFNRWPQDWPDKSKHVVPHDVTRAQYEELVALLQAKAGEREIEKFLSRNREALSMVIWMFPTGHHMSWIFPKPPFRPSVGMDVFLDAGIALCEIGSLGFVQKETFVAARLSLIAGCREESSF